MYYQNQSSHRIWLNIKKNAADYFFLRERKRVSKKNPKQTNKKGKKKEKESSETSNHDRK